MTTKNYSTKYRGLSLLLDESPSLFMALYSSSLNLPENSIKYSLLNTTKRILKKYVIIQKKLSNINKKQVFLLPFFRSSKAKKSLILALDQLKNMLFSWIIHSLGKFGL